MTMGELGELRNYYKHMEENFESCYRDFVLLVDHTHLLSSFSWIDSVSAF